MRKKRFFVINYPTYIVCENEKGYTFFQKIFSIFLRASRIFEQNKKTPPGEPDGAFDLDLRVVLLDSCLCCKRHIAPTISYPHAHIQIHPLIDSPAGRKAVDILLRIVDGQCKGTDFDVVIRVKFAFLLVSGSQIPAKLIL